MSRGGFRAGAGRKPGAVNRLTRNLLTAVEATGESDLFTALTMVAEDTAHAMDVRMEAARRLHGLISGRIYLSAPADEAAA